MINFFIACGGGNAAAAGNGCYDWPVIKQIVWFFGKCLGILYDFLATLGIPNIGLAIIIFTLITKLVLLPMTIQQQKFSKLTSYMQPELSAIQAKYRGRSDQYSVQAMQTEMKLVYAKYGTSQTGGCIQSFIQFPILIALYGALRDIPIVIGAINKTLTPIADILTSSSDAIKESVQGVSSLLASAISGGDADILLQQLYLLPTKSWTALQGLFSGADATTIATNYAQFTKLNSFCGLDISQTPWNLIRGGGIGIIAILIPAIAGASQWLSFKLTQTKESANTKGDMTASSMKTMGYFMPLMSIFFCFTLNAGLGLYWCLSSLFQIVLQIMINRHYRKIDMDEFIKNNMEKAAEKAKKKREKDGVKGSVISSAAAINTKNIEAPTPEVEYRPRSIKDIANMDVNDTSAKMSRPSSTSLAAKAGAVKDYNEAHPEDMPNSGVRRKYKK